MKFSFLNRILIVVTCFFSTQLLAQTHTNEWLRRAEEFKDGGKYTEAISCIQQAISLAQQFANDTLYLHSLVSLGDIQTTLNQYDKAEINLLKAKELALKLNLQGQLSYAVILNNLATLYKLMGYYDQAESLFLEAKDIRLRLLGEQNIEYAAVVGNLASLYHKMKQWKLAEKLYLDNKNIVARVVGKQHRDYGSAINNLATFYYQLDRIEEAKTLFLESLVVTEKAYGKNHLNYATSLNNLAGLYGRLRQFEKAKTLQFQSMELRRKLLGTEHQLYANSLNNLGRLYWKNNQLDSAYHYCLMSIAANSPDVDSLPVLDSLDKYEYYNNEKIITSLQTLLEILSAQPPHLSNLQQQYSISQAAIRLNERIRNDFTTDGNKLYVLVQNDFFVQKGIQSALQLQQARIKPLNYYEQAFQFAEQNKSNLLANALQAQRAQAMGNLPEALINKELQLQQALDKCKKNKIETKDSIEKIAINAQLAELNLEIEAFKDTIQKKYPAYHKLKYAHLNASVADIQRILPPKAALLEYYVADTVAYIFCLTAQKMYVYPIGIQQDTFKLNVRLLRQSLSDYDLIRKTPDLAYTQYTTTAFYFYTTFVQPVLGNLKDIEQLIIVPDDLLGHLPFEAFLVEPAPAQPTPYNQLHYLVEDIAISYSYSATLLQENFQTAQKINNGKLLTVAANYNLGQQDSLLYRSPAIRRLRKSLLELPAARQEAEKIYTLLGGKLLLDTAANEHTFKDLAGEYKIIHLALHGLLNTQHPILSSLAFTENGDTTEDNFLQAWEISKLQLQADLIVLSACETGYGKFQQGEGVMSLGRAFMYAGVPSLVMSLWAVNDQSTAVMMQNFYQELNKGTDKARALRQAKLHYLEQNTGLAAHPAFWAAFIQLGDSQAIQVSSKKYGWWIIGGASLVLMGLLVYKFKNK